MLAKISPICNGFECSIGTKRQLCIPFQCFIPLIHYKWLHEPNLRGGEKSEKGRRKVSSPSRAWEDMSDWNLKESDLVIGLAGGSIKRKLKLLAIWKDCRQFLGQQATLLKVATEKLRSTEMLNR